MAMMMMCSVMVCCWLSPADGEDDDDGDALSDSGLLPAEQQQTMIMMTMCP